MQFLMDFFLYVRQIIDYLSTMVFPSDLYNLLESSEVVGNIRFSHPTLYVFPGGQGDAALFGINGFNMLGMQIFYTHFIITLYFFHYIIIHLHFIIKISYVQLMEDLVVNHVFGILYDILIGWMLF